MEIDRKELKRQARERMALTDPKFWVVALVYIAMTTGVSWLVSFIPVPSGGASPVPFLDIQLFFQLLLILYTTVVSFGLCLWALWTWRQLDPGVNSLMQGFSVAGRVLLMELDIFIRTLGWYLCVVLGLSIPVILVFSLLLPFPSNPAGLFIYPLYASLAIYLLSALYMAALLAAFIVLSLRYALAPYLLADRPDDRTSNHIFRSVSLMRGWKRELLKLELSFIGWDAVKALLSFAVFLFFLSRAGLLTADAFMSSDWRNQAVEVFYSTPSVILRTLVTIPVSLWLIPYRSVARAGFYDARLQAASQEGPPLPEIPPL